MMRALAACVGAPLAHPGASGVADNYLHVGIWVRDLRNGAQSRSRSSSGVSCCQAHAMPRAAFQETRMAAARSSDHLFLTRQTRHVACRVAA